MSQFLGGRIQRLIALAALTFVAACGPAVYKAELGSSSSSSRDTFTIGPDGTLPVHPVEPRTGIAQFNAINENYLALTTINRSSCNREYQNVMNSLPSTNDIEAVTASVQTATMRLSACYCKELAIDNDNGSWGRVLAGIDRDRRGSDLSEADILNMAQTLRARFLGSNLAHLNEAAIDAEVVRIINESLRLDASRNSSGATRRAAFSGCALILSSLNSMLL